MGAQTAVTWKLLNRVPFFAMESENGMTYSEPKQLKSAKPTSSKTAIRILGWRIFVLGVQPLSVNPFCRPSAKLGCSCDPDLALTTLLAAEAAPVAAITSRNFLLENCIDLLLVLLLALLLIGAQWPATLTLLLIV